MREAILKENEEMEENKKFEEIISGLYLIEEEHTSENNSNPEENEKREREKNLLLEEAKVILRPISGETKSAVDKIKLIKEDTSTKSDEIKSIISELLKYYEEKGKVDDIPSAISDIMYHCETRALDVFFNTIFYIASKPIKEDWVERVISTTVEAFDAMPVAEEKVVAKCVEALRRSGKSILEIAEILYKIIKSKPDLIDEIIKGLVLACKLSEFSELFLEIIKNNPTPENIKLCMEAVVKYALGYDVNLDYTINTLKKIIEKYGYDDSIISGFSTLIESVSLEYLSEKISKGNFYKLLSSLIGLKIEPDYLNSKYIDSIWSGLFSAYEGRSDINSLLLKLSLEKPECLEEILLLYISRQDYEGLREFSNDAIGEMNYEKVPSFIKNIIKTLKFKQVSNDKICEIFVNLIEDNLDGVLAFYATKGVTSYYIDNSSEDMNELYELILKVFELQREKYMVDMAYIVGGAISCMIDNGKTDEVRGFLSLAVSKITDPKKIEYIILGISLGIGGDKKALIDKLAELLSDLNKDKIKNIDVFSLMTIDEMTRTILRDTLSKDNIEKLTFMINKIYSGASNNKEKILNAKRLVLYQILSNYYYEWLINKTGVSEETKTAILNLFEEVFGIKYGELSQIKFSDFELLYDSYCKTKFKTFGVSGGYLLEIFSKIMLDRKTKDDKIKPEDFNDILFVNIQEKFGNYIGTITKEEFFKRIGLKEEDFGRKNSGEKSLKTVVFAGYWHFVVAYIDTLASWTDAIKDDVGSEAIKNKFGNIAMFDSSWHIKEACEKGIIPKNLKEFLERIEFLNEPYQEGESCHMHAPSAVSATREYNTFKDLLEDFGYQIEYGKIKKKENSEFKPLQYKTIAEALLSFLLLLSKECKDAEESVTVASSSSSDNPPDEEYGELSIKTSEKYGYTIIKQSDYFVEISKMIEALEGLSRMTSEYKDKESRLSKEGDRLVEIGERIKDCKPKEPIQSKLELRVRNKKTREVTTFILGKTSWGGIICEKGCF